MSMEGQGSSTLAWVCRWSSGFCRASSPAIHILAGEKVCIQAIRPMQSSSALAARQIRRIAAASVSTGFQTTRTGIGEASSAAAICWDCSATWRRVSSP